MQDAKPLYVYQQQVVPAQFVALAPLISGFISIFPAGFTFILSNMMFGGFDPIVWPAFLAYLISFGVVMYLCYLAFFKEPPKMTYRIFSDRLEFTDGFLNKQHRTVMFDNVIDLRLDEGVLQQTKNVGSITLTTQQMVSDSEGKLSNRTFTLRNISQPKEAYDQLCQLALAKK